MATPSLNLKVIDDAVLANVSTSSNELPLLSLAAVRNIAGSCTFDPATGNWIICDGTVKHIFLDSTATTALINSILTTNGLLPFIKIQVAVLQVNIPNNRVPADSPQNTTFNGLYFWPPTQAASLATRIGTPAPGISDFLTFAGEHWKVETSISGCITTGSVGQSGSTRVSGVLVQNTLTDVVTLGSCTLERIAAQPNAFGVGIPPAEVVLNASSAGSITGNFEFTAAGTETYSLNIHLAGVTGTIEVNFSNYVSTASNNLIFTRYLP